MLYWLVMFLVLAVVAGIFGFWIAATAIAGIARLLFYLFLIGLAVTAVMHLRGRRRI
jgi:uncharacterized membrane protein YtjA (UPF0391 family)